MSSLEQINIGYLPLLDASLLIVAEEKGFARDEGVHINLVKETSWANIRDRIAIGHFDAAHMLAPMPIAANLDLNPLNVKMIAPMALGLGGNAVTVSTGLWAKMKGEGAPDDLSAMGTGTALRKVVAANPDEKLRFGVVHPHSGHNYELRYWLAASGIAPDADVDIVIIPPPLMPDALAAGTIDGYCVGEPWNSVAVAAGYGRIPTLKSRIWRSSPEKVLGLTADWASRHSDCLMALLRSLQQAAIWCGQSAHHEDMAAILSESRYLDQPADLILRGLSGAIDAGDGYQTAIPDFFVPNDRAATFPWVSHALWFYTQMVRWGQVSHTADHARAAAESYRPDLYRLAFKDSGLPVPGASLKVEGALTESTPVGVTQGRLNLGPDGFFDGRVFDPDDLDRYIDEQTPNQSA